MVDGKMALSLAGMFSGFMVVGSSSSWRTALGLALVVGGNNLYKTLRAKQTNKVLASGNKEEKK
jgi:hypothetical protein